jgi:hypothetical protein
MPGIIGIGIRIVTGIVGVDIFTARINPAPAPITGVSFRLAGVGIDVIIMSREG